MNFVYSPDSKQLTASKAIAKNKANINVIRAYNCSAQARR